MTSSCTDVSLLCSQSHRNSLNIEDIWKPFGNHCIITGDLFCVYCIKRISFQSPEVLMLCIIVVVKASFIPVLHGAC